MFHECSRRPESRGIGGGVAASMGVWPHAAQSAPFPPRVNRVVRGSGGDGVRGWANDEPGREAAEELL
jgi:hypothetical protein